MLLNKNMVKEKERIEISDVLLSSEDLENHAKAIAKNHSVTKKTRTIQSVINRLDHNFETIVSVYEHLNRKAYDKRNFSPASEWLLDNFYKIEEQVKVIREEISRKNFLDLNVLDRGFLKGFPRSYAIALELVSHTDGSLDEEAIVRFVNAYQTYSALSISELWSLSSMIRVALVERIRNVCEMIHLDQLQFERMEKITGKDPEEIFSLIKEELENMQEIDTSYIHHLLRTLRREQIDTGEIMDYIEKKLFDFNMTTVQIIDWEHKEQAARKIAIGNAIVSLNVVSKFNWNHIFETLCVAEKILREDPAGVYGQMDFESRDYYRHQIVRIADRCNVSEIKVARKAVECAKEAYEQGKGEKQKHVGYYIIGKGRKRLFEELGCKKAPDVLCSHSVAAYLSGIFLITALIAGALGCYAYRISENIFIGILAGIVTLIPASDVAVTGINWLAMRLVPPAFLPKLEYREGIPDEAATVVVIPALLTSVEMVEKLLERLEIYYAGNRDKNIYFGLIGDFKDGKNEREPEDEKIENAAAEGIRKLNEKYGHDGDRFFYLHRRRQYNEKQKLWMGWERKRGALVEFNEWLLGAKNTSFYRIEGDPEKLIGKIRYVITLDADTRLYLDVARKLIGTIAHPLHHAEVDPEKKIVVDGYGIIQPKIGIDVDSANHSIFTKIYAGQGGIDTYSTAVSDVYQDLMGEGIFTGKGIYDLHAFSNTLKTAIPDNTLLSHDLLEGSYLRTGLVTDIELIDGYPGKYSSFMVRLHRWVRGDWQLIGWLKGTVKDRAGRKVRNPLSPLSKWKIFDNLRRSLVPVSLLILFALGWTVFPGTTWIWTGFGFFVLGMPLWLEGLSFICSGFQGCRNRKHNRNIIYGAKAVLYQILLQFVFLPYQAYLMSDAILRTLYRICISKTNLLEWTTAADAEKRLKNDLQSFFKRMRMAIVIAVILVGLVAFYNVQNTACAALFGVIWAVSPAVAYWISKEEKEEIPRLQEADHQTLRRIARKTWAYYEDFAGAQDHYLPADNYQENPPNGVAHRTSPTNIGFYLLSILAARDLGYLTTGKMLEKLNQTLTTVEKMDTWKGHLYNWYNTKTLELLCPMYVSTVDSGNFIGYLMTLKQGLLEYLEKPILDRNLILGLKDTFELMDEAERTDVDFSVLSRSEGMTWNEWVEWIHGAQSVQKKLPPDFCETLRPTPFNQEQVFECLSKVNWAKKFQSMLEDLKAETDRLFVAPFSQEEKERGGEIYNQLEVLGEDVSLNALKELYDHLLRQVDQRLELDFASDAEKKALQSLQQKINTAKKNVESMIYAVQDLVSRIDAIVEKTDFSPLYDPKKNLFSIGYDVHENKLTNSYYDLLASEARIASYIAVTHRQVPKIHWNRLGRTLTLADGYKALVSWTGTMFEYFMPSLILKNYRNTLMDETYATVIHAQKQYGKKRNVPWGTSESGYYAFDRHLNYQYKAFGVPDLGLKRGLVNDMVISPYSTILGLPFDPQGAMENINRLIRDGVEGAYGFYEAIDYTPERLVHGQKKELVRNFMAHHQGMILLALNNYLNHNPMQKRFHSDPVIASGEILLQEKIPVRAIITKEYKEPVRPLEVPKREEIRVVRKYHEPAEILPRCHILSNGKYFVMVTDAGSGYSKNEGIQVSRWREDRLAGKYGTFIFLRDVENNRIWASAFDPLGVEPDGYQVNFSLDKAEFFRTDENIDTHTEIVVSPEDDVEIRKVSLTNHRSEPALIEVTSYFETVLTDQNADVAHPAFSNLFIRTEAVEQYGALIASRRPRMEGNPTIWAAHISVVEGGELIGNMQYETNRGNFIGRGRDISDPIALSKPLSNTTGPVLDPIMSIRRMLKIPPGESATVTYITGVAKDREAILEIVQKYHDPASIKRSFQLAYTRSQMEMAYLDLKAEEVEIYQDMISHIVFLSPCRKKYEEILKKNQRGQSNLWAYGISGDYPIVLLSIKREEEIDQVIQLLKAHEYWRMKGFSVDLVILNEDESSYLQPLQQLLKETVRSKYGSDMQDRPGGVFIRDANGMPKEDIYLLYAAARIILKAEKGSIRAQLKIRDCAEAFPEEKRFRGEIVPYPSREKPLELDYFNGYGGFQKDGKEYVIRLKEEMQTPAPWINVLANKRFGCIVTESGSGFTWAENSRENKLTPWSNDPVSDTPGEAIYLRDE
ncbi:MAG TPA: glycosyl transferase, partial [Clostridiales bacterium]|nr:glycosyl transferase [Clostridiales bacterium]